VTILHSLVNISQRDVSHVSHSFWMHSLSVEVIAFPRLDLTLLPTIAIHLTSDTTSIRFPSAVKGLVAEKGRAIQPWMEPRHKFCDFEAYVLDVRRKCSQVLSNDEPRCQSESTKSQDYDYVPLPAVFASSMMFTATCRPTDASTSSAISSGAVTLIDR